MYKIIEYKDNIITIECDDAQFKEGDFIRICNFETIDLQDDRCLKKQYKIQNINQNKNNVNLTITNCKGILNGLYIMNMSLQNSIHISY